MKVSTGLKASIAAIAFSAMSMLTAAPSAATTVLKVAEPDHTSGLITCRLIEFIIEDWNYDVTRIPLITGPAVLESVRAGETQYGCEAWPSYTKLKERFIREFGGDGTVVYLGKTGVTGKGGYYVPRYVVSGNKKRKIKAKAPKLKTWEDLNKHKKVFATKETGSSGRLIGCPLEEWRCMDKRRLLDLKIDFEAQSLGSETAHWEAIRAAYKKGKPFLAYAWEPHWIHAEMDLVKIELPKYWKETWPASGWPEDVPFNFANPTFVMKHQQVAQLIGNLKLTNAQQAEMLHEIEVKKRDVDEVVREWMAKNEEVWKAWVPAGA